jgi:hypothetical protein
MNLVIAIACIAGICRAVQIWFSIRGAKLFLYTDAFGMAIKIARLQTSQRAAATFGLQNSDGIEAAMQGIKRL